MQPGFRSGDAKGNECGCGIDKFAMLETDCKAKMCQEICPNNGRFNVGLHKDPLKRSPKTDVKCERPLVDSSRGDARPGRSTKEAYTDCHREEDKIVPLGGSGTTAHPLQSESLVSDAGASESPVIISYVSQKTGTEADLARPPLRPPNSFHPGDDFSPWAFRAQNFLQTIHPPKHVGPYLVSLLDDSAARQLATELVDTYAGALSELALGSLSHESPDRRETEVLKRFTLGVLNAELYSEFVRKKYTSLQKALEVARGYEAAEVAQSQIAATHLFSVAERRPYSRRTQPHSIGDRQNSPANSAGGLGVVGIIFLFVPSLRRISRTPIYNSVLVSSRLRSESTQVHPSLYIHAGLTTGKRPRQPVTATATAGQSRPSRLFYISDKSSGLRFLVDTGAEISAIPPPRRHHLKPSQFSLQAANCTTINTYGQRSPTLDIGLRRRFQWVFVQADVKSPIIGADFLTHFGLAVDLTHRKLIDTTTTLFTIGIAASEPSVSIQLTVPSSPFADIMKDYSSLTKPYFLGHHVDQHGVTSLLEKVHSILSFPVPKVLTQLRRFIGLLNYYRRFIPHCEATLVPLTDFLKSHTKPIELSLEDHSAFEADKKALADATASPSLLRPSRTADID
ncbi:hypothetical protein SprV_0802488700 [Sparganum proliferum]